MQRIAPLTLALIALTAAGLARGAPAEPSGTAAPALGVNAFVKDFFVDLMKSGHIQGLDKEKPLERDEEGWPKDDCAISFGGSGGYRTGHGPNIAGEYQLAFVCDNPDVEVTLAGGGKSVLTRKAYDPATKTWTGTIAIPQETGANVRIGVQFVNTRGGVRHVRLLRPGYGLDTPETEVYGPLNKIIAPFGGPFRPTSDQGQKTLPFPAVREWNQRTSLPFQPAPMGQDADGPFPTWEWQVIAANGFNRDLWINVPINATDDYVEHLARAIKDGSEYRGHTYPALQPGLKLYVEYSNEVWNFGFYQFMWNLHAARDALAKGNLDAPFSMTADSKAPFLDVNLVLRYTARAAEVARIFRRVFGEEQTMNRVRPVLAWQVNNGATWQAMGDFVERFYGPPGELFYGIGDAPYVAPGRQDGETLDAMNAQTEEILDRYAKEHWRQSVAGARSAGLRYACYEGGGFNAYTKPAKQAQYNWLYDPRIKGLTARYWTDLLAAGADMLVWTGLYGPANERTGGSWGIVEDIFHPEDSPRWMGTKEVSEAPRPPLQAAAVLDGSKPVTLNLGEYAFQVESVHPLDRIKDRAGRLYLGQPLKTYTVTILANQAGLYALTLTGSELKSNDCPFHVRCDGVAASELTLPHGGDPRKDQDWVKTSTPAVLALEPGLHALQLRADPGSRDSRKVQDLVFTPAKELPRAAPAAPPAIEAYPEHGRVLVFWEAAAHNGHRLTAYNLYRGDAAGQEKLYKAGLPAGTLCLADTDVKSGRAYSYRVTAVNEVGEGKPSASVQAASVERPAAPTDLKAEVSQGADPGTGKVSLAWTPPAGRVDFYAVYFSRKPGEEAKESTGFWILVPGGRPSYVFLSDQHPFNRSGVRARDGYFQISAINGAGEGLRSAELHVSVNAAR